MHTMKSLLPIFFLLSLFADTGCRERKSAPIANSVQSIAGMDTGRIGAALRAFDVLPPDTKGKPAILERIRNEAVAMGYNDQVCLLSMDLGRGQADRGNFDSTLHYFQYARPYCFKPLLDKSLPAIYLTEFATFYYGLKSDYEAANKCYYEALTYLKANDMGDHEMVVSLYYFLHANQVRLGHYDQALAYLREGERIAVKTNSEQGLPAIRGGLGDFYSQRKNYAIAEQYYDSVLKVEKEIWDPNILIMSLTGKGAALANTGRAQGAIPYFEKAIKVARENKIVYNEVSATVGLGSAYNKVGRYKETVELVTNVLKGKEEKLKRKEGEADKVLMEAYEGMGRYKEALEYQRRHHAAIDSLGTVGKATALNELELKFQTANKNKELASRKLQIQEQKNKLAENRALIAGISAVAVLALIILVYSISAAAQRHKLQQLEIETLQRQQEISVLRSTIQGEEQERKRLSRELHDGIGSMIFSAIMLVSLLKKQEPSTVTTKEYDDVLRLLEQTGSEVRKTAQNMMPDIIAKQTLFEAVRTYCETITVGTQVKVDVEFYGGMCDFSTDIKLVIYRVIQELVHNIVKYADATYAIVQGVLNGDNLTITVEDNGKGFDTTSPRRGMGLKNVESRVRSLYGEFQIDSAPGKGTTVYMEFDCGRLSKEDGVGQSS
jgi:two-component system NarL family sensor kinase